ncbi:hypothetical protein F2Q70_00010905 [Brassica cretica]|uniref:Uncharacterized protein n=1 Tax=Brassica cretica TaxID=69181 RepID=A0A8S9M1N0_BRACR|nr:hypothetical protein F2Q70_00010905 [Brassica cretica]
MASLHPYPPWDNRGTEEKRLVSGGGWQISHVSSTVRRGGAFRWRLADTSSTEAEAGYGISTVVAETRPEAGIDDVVFLEEAQVRMERRERSWG